MDGNDLMKGHLRLNVLVFREGDRWVAQVLEKDMAAHGETPYAALSAIGMIIQAHVNFDTFHQRTPFSRLDRAPDVYWDVMERATPLPQPESWRLMPASIVARQTNERIAGRTS